MQIESGKKELVYFKEVNTMKLMEELYTAIPELKPVLLDNDYKINLRVFTNGDKLILWVPTDIVEENINAIINNHIAIEKIVEENVQEGEV